MLSGTRAPNPPATSTSSTSPTTTRIPTTGEYSPGFPACPTSCKDGRMAVSFGDTFTLTLLTDDPDLAVEADRAGVQRIGVDLETIGKAARQRGHDTRLSTHSWDDLDVVGGVVCRAGLFVRINPIHDGTDLEVERALASRASVLMLPSFSTACEVERFVD